MIAFKYKKKKLGGLGILFYFNTLKPPSESITLGVGLQKNQTRFRSLLVITVTRSVRDKILSKIQSTT